MSSTSRTAMGLAKLHKVFLIHRHGDRCPVLPGTLGSSDEAEESKSWATLLCATDLNSRLDRVLPVENQANSPPTDGNKPPFGMLTRKGMNQLFRLGCSIRSRYFCDQIAVSEFKVQTFSSNYRRTQQSAQLLLLGLRSALDDNVIVRIPHDDQSADDIERALSAMEEEANKSEVPPAVVVRSNSKCVINPFARYSEMLSISNEMMKSKQFNEFQQHHGLDQIQKELERSMPMFSETSSPFHNKFSWLLAADALKGYKFHPELQVPTTLQPIQHHADAAFQHMSWQFEEFYSNGNLLKFACGDILNEILIEMETAFQYESIWNSGPVGMASGCCVFPALATATAATVCSDTSTPRLPSARLKENSECIAEQRIFKKLPELNGAGSCPNIEIYSGHDTTLMPILIALGVWDTIWPPHASLLAFELWQVETSPGKLEWLIQGRYQDQVLVFPAFEKSPSGNLISVPNFRKRVEHVLHGNGPTHALRQSNL